MDQPAIDLARLRRVLIERSGSAGRIIDLSFNDLLRHGADAGLISDPGTWRIWRELHNAASQADDQARAEQVARDAGLVCADARALLAALEAAP